MYKQSSIALLLAVTLLGGCKTLDSVSNISAVTVPHQSKSRQLTVKRRLLIWRLSRQWPYPSKNP